MATTWLQMLKDVLQEYYPVVYDENIVGYLKGSGEPAVWWAMAKQNQPQMLILGSVPPTKKDWVAAGKPFDEPVHTVVAKELHGLIILYGGFPTRPWGRIEILDSEALASFPASLESFRRNKPPH